MFEEFRLANNETVQTDSRNFVTHRRNNSQIFFVMFGEVYLEDKKKLKNSVADYYSLFLIRT